MYRQIGVRSHGKGIFHKEPVTGKSLGDKRVFWVHPQAFVVNIVFGWEQAVALTSAAEDGFIASHRFPMFVPVENKTDLNFLLLFFLRKKGKYLLELASPGGAGRNKTLGQTEFAKLVMTLPTLPEQQKIAAFVGAIDNKLEALHRKYELLQSNKRGLMQKIFSQEMRFNNDDGTNFPDWKKVKFGEVFTRVNRRNVSNCNNVLTISAQQGLVSQQDFFNKSVASKNVEGYFLLKKGDFAYNKSYSKGYPMGAMKRLNKYEEGVVSPLYICFSTKNETYARFYEQYFESGFLNRELHKIAQEGARNHGLLNFSVVSFFKEIDIPKPCIIEQQKIADCLSVINSKIDAVSGQIEKMKQFKKGLLQQMFV
jgi:type I restriction enzyme S subunit